MLFRSRTYFRKPWRWGTRWTKWEEEERRWPRRSQEGREEARGAWGKRQRSDTDCGGQGGTKKCVREADSESGGEHTGKVRDWVRGWRDRFPATFSPTDALWLTAASGALGRRLTLCWGAKRGQGVSKGTGRRGRVPSPSSSGCPSAQVNLPPFPLLDVKSPFHPATLLNCCKNHL